MTRRQLTVKGAGPQATVTIYLHAFRGQVWITCFDCPFTAEAVLQPSQAENLSDLLQRTATEARRYTTDTGS